MKPTSLNSLLDKVTDPLLASGLLKWFMVVKEYSEEPPPIPLDEMQPEQVIRDLEINAAHAMGNAGVLTIGTRFTTEDKSNIEF
jgi:signal transduction histidine kinase